jgi:hypothetical protein
VGPECFKVHRHSERVFRKPLSRHLRDQFDAVRVVDTVNCCFSCVRVLSFEQKGAPQFLRNRAHFLRALKSGNAARLAWEFSLHVSESAGRRPAGDG